jgi:hypothetical protein
VYGVFISVDPRGGQSDGRDSELNGDFLEVRFGKGVIACGIRESGVVSVQHATHTCAPMVFP